MTGHRKLMYDDMLEIMLRIRENDEMLLQLIRFMSKIHSQSSNKTSQELLVWNEYGVDW